MTTPNFYSEFEADRGVEAECDCCGGEFAPWATKLLIIQKGNTVIVSHFCDWCAAAYENNDPDAKVTFIDK